MSKQPPPAPTTSAIGLALLLSAKLVGRPDTESVSSTFAPPDHPTRGAAETKLTIEKLLKGHYSGQNQLSMTSIKYHLQVMETITGKFHRNTLKTVGGVAETRTSVDKMAKTDKGPYPW